MQENIDFSVHKARADAELDAACRSTQAEETELHLRLALYHLQRRHELPFERIPAPSANHRSAIYHTDKEG